MIKHQGTLFVILNNVKRHAVLLIHTQGGSQDFRKGGQDNVIARKARKIFVTRSHTY